MLPPGAVYGLARGRAGSASFQEVFRVGDRCQAVLTPLELIGQLVVTGIGPVENTFGLVHRRGLSPTTS